MPTDQAVNPFMQFPIIPYLLIFMIFYFLVIKPQKTKQNEHKQMLANLKKNDQIVTSGGIHAVVSLVKDTTVVARVDDNVKIEIDKEAISRFIKGGK